MNKASILVVEDERIVARDIQRTLQKAGYTVMALVPTGLQAVAKAAELRPDLVLMDIVVPGEIDGIEAARRIRLQQEVPIVYLTANGDHTILERSKETEPIAFISKPYEEQELLTTIEISLHRYRTQNQRAQAAVQVSEARYQELFESARDGIAITDLDGVHLKCNQAYLALLHYPTVGDLPRYLAAVTAPDFRNVEAQMTREQTLGRGYSDEYEKECLCRDGVRVSVSARSWLRRDEQGRPAGFWLMLRDITERKAADQRVWEYQGQLQTLMKDLAVAEERERQRIACDIHDRIGQTLAVCQMRLAAMAQATDSPAVARETEAISQLLEQTIRDTSSLIFELSPPVLHQLGLGPALEWFGEKLQQQHQVRIDVQTVRPPEPVPVDLRAALFRAACELMNNAAKHAHAAGITVLLAWPAGAVQIQVRDDGVGFASSEALRRQRESGGFGLFHIRERLRGWGGSLEIQSRPGAGTCAIMTVPRENRGTLA